MCAWQINKMGCFVMVAWVLAFIFYMYIRITKTMDLGQYLAYGIYVLVVEVTYAAFFCPSQTGAAACPLLCVTNRRCRKTAIMPWPSVEPSCAVVHLV